MSPEPHEDKVIYFQPGQIVFLVAGDSSESRTGELLAQAGKLANDHQHKEVRMTRKFGLDFRSTLSPYKKDKSKEFSQERLDGEKPYLRPEIVSRESFGLVFTEVEGITDPDALLDLIISLDRDLKAGPDGPLKVVSPNWLTSGGSQPGATGGPGGKPTPYTGAANTKEYIIHPPSQIHDLCKGKEGEGVVVAILDTAPYDPNATGPQDSNKILDDIYDANPEHSLIKTLLVKENRPLTVFLDQGVQEKSQYIRSDEGELPWYIEVKGHEYDMTDHGLFVAGIIHSLARRAKLRLYQVLNRYGVGDLLSVARALQKIVDDLSNNPDTQLVVNLSLTLNTPVEPGHSKNDLGGLILGRDKEWRNRQAWPMEWISDSVYTLNSRLIAAAGNDRKKGKERPAARYPAAFERVVGVGALPKIEPGSSGRRATASYSNKSDRPASKGITTLGGEEGEIDGMPQGVLGIYLGSFPESDSNPNPAENKNGWGWWSGTSFATPIISGITAAVLSNMPPGTTTQEAIEKLYEAQAFLTDPPDDEDVLSVTQG